MNETQEGRIFYGWWIVLASSIIIFFGTGIAFYSFGVFIKPIEADLGWSREVLSLGVAAWALVFGFSGPIVGILLHKYGARVVIAGSGLIAGVSYMLLMWVGHLYQFFILMIIIGFAAVGITLIPNQTLISNWFQKYRGRAMGLMTAGIGLGGFTMPQVANYVIELKGWRTSFFLLGLLILIFVVPVALLVVRTKPSDMGMKPDGEPTRDRKETEGSFLGDSTDGGLSVGRAMKSLSFWMLFAAFALLVFGESGFTVHFVALVDDAGVSSQRAAFFWGLVAGVSVVGRLGFGFLSDRWNPRNLITVTHALHGVATVGLLVFFLDMGITSAVTLFPFSIVYGLSLGGSAVLLPVLVGRCFGLLNFSKLLGLLMSGFAVGVLGGPYAAGAIAHKTGSYRPAIIIFAIGFGLAAFAVALVRPDKYKSEFVQR